MERVFSGTRVLRGRGFRRKCKNRPVSENRVKFDSRRLHHSTRPEDRRRARSWCPSGTSRASRRTTAASPLPRLHSPPRRCHRHRHALRVHPPLCGWVPLHRIDRRPRHAPASPPRRPRCHVHRDAAPGFTRVLRVSSNKAAGPAPRGTDQALDHRLERSTNRWRPRETPRTRATSSRTSDGRSRRPFARGRVPRQSTSPKVDSLTVERQRMTSPSHWTTLVL